MNRPLIAETGVARNGRPPGRGGFTLVELLMVIGVIAILAGILLTAVGGASRTVYIAQTVADIKDIESGLLGFKDKYGVFPPSALVLPEDSTIWDSTSASFSALTPEQQASVVQSARAIRDIFPQWSPPTTGVLDWNQDGDTTDFIYLNGSESMMFFLGGGRVSGTVPVDEQVYTGFSKNPVQPFTLGTTNREKPLFEISSSRLVDTDSDGMPEYLDQYPDQTIPYAYFRAVRDGIYTPAGIDGILGTADDETPPGGPAMVYYKSIVQPTPDPNPGPTIDTSSIPTGIPYGNGRFQLVSPGDDGEFGIGGIYTEGGSPPIPSGSYIITNSDASTVTLERKPLVESDNIASFAGGTLQ